MEVKSVFISVRLSKELRRLIRAKAKKEKLSVSELLRKFIEKGMNENERAN